MYCRELLFSLRFDDLSKELKKLLCHDLSGIEGSDTLNFYNYLVELRKKGKSDRHVSDSYMSEVKAITAFYRNPMPITGIKFLEYRPETQVLILDKMFAAQLWGSIIRMHDDNLRLDSLVEAQLSYYAGLSYFNIHDFNHALEAFEKLAEGGDEKYKILYLCSNIQVINSQIVDGDRKSEDRLVDLIEELEKYRNHSVYRSNELLMAVIFIEACFNLGCRDRRFLYRAFSAYESFSDEVREEPAVIYRLAICKELNGNIDEAIALYESLDWKNDEIIAQRYLVALYELGKADEIIKKYDSIKDKNPRVDGIYLLALSKVDDKTYEKKLAEELTKHRASYEDIFLISYYVEDENVYQKLVLPVIEELFKNEKKDISVKLKMGYILLFAKWKNIELLDIVIASVDRLSMINAYVTQQIYKAAYEVVQREYKKEKHGFIRNSDMESANRIAERMISEKINEAAFLQIRIMYAGAMGMTYSMLSYSKAFFSITGDLGTARNIVALLCECGENSSKEYEPYLDSLKNSENPDYCMMIANAKLKQGKTEEADFYAYKALYFLNGKDDFDIYLSFWGYHFANLRRYCYESPHKVVTGNMVVTLKKLGTEVEQKCVCLDSEDDYDDPNNMSMNIEHIPKSETLYSKLQGGVQKQAIKIGESRYEIVDFVPRNIFAGRYVLEKINKNPEKFNNKIWVIADEDPKTVIEQMFMLGDRTEHMNTLLRAYFREDGGLGLPIDAFTAGDYGKYIDALRMLLLVKDNLFNAGQPTIEDFDDSDFVPTISTLVLLAIMGWLNMLGGLQGKIIVPGSYIKFFKKQYSNTVDMQAVSPGTLAKNNGQMILYEPDKSLPDIWESIIDFLADVKTEEITDDERIEFPLIEGISGEQLITGMKMDVIQLDALILAKKRDAYFLCDDFFFRQIAHIVGIKHNNFVSLLYHLPLEEASKYALELSKTNYIHTPLMSASEEDALQMIENFALGKRKRAYYADFFDMAIRTREKMLNELFEISSEDLAE